MKHWKLDLLTWALAAVVVFGGLFLDSLQTYTRPGFGPDVNTVGVHYADAVMYNDFQDDDSASAQSLHQIISASLEDEHGQMESNCN